MFNKFTGLVDVSVKLSIVTINFNNLDGLKRTINSVVSQTWKDFEYIIIDGGSTDGSVKYISEHKNFFTYSVSEPDKGIFNAMNKGITKARGQFVYFLNSGDVLYMDQLGVCMEFVQDVNKIYNFKYFLSDGLVLQPVESIYYDLVSLLDTMVNHQSLIYGKNCFENFQFNESYSICSDFDHLVKLLIAGTETASVKQFLSIYDTGGVSFSAGSAIQIAKERKQILTLNININLQSILAECKSLRGKSLNMKNSRMLKVLRFLGFLKSCF